MLLVRFYVDNLAVLEHLKVRDVIFASERSVNSVMGGKNLPGAILGKRERDEKGCHQADKSHDAKSLLQF